VHTHSPLINIDTFTRSFFCQEMATQQEYLQLRTSKTGHRELILLWPSAPDIDINQLEQITQPLAEISVDASVCARYIHENKDYTKIFVIISNGNYPRARELIRDTRFLLRLQYREIQWIIYVLGQNNNADADKDVQYFNNFNALFERLKEDLLATNCRSSSPVDIFTPFNSVSYFICDLSNIKKENACIYWKRLLVDTLIELDQPDAEILQGMERLREEFRTDKITLRQIDNFQTNYDRLTREGGGGPIHWFTNGSFMSKVLQRALKTANMDQLFSLRFFIRDLYRHLQRVQEEGANQSNLVVYRSLVADHDHPINELMTTNTFFSTSISPDFARIFIQPHISTLYEIHTRSKANTDFVYANLS